MERTSPSATRFAPLFAGAVVVAGLYLASALLVPMVLAVLLAFVLAPLVVLLQRAHLGHTPSVLIAAALAFAAIGGIGLVVGLQVSTLVASMPAYQEAVRRKIEAIPRIGHELAAQIDALVHPAQAGVQAGVHAAAAEGLDPASTLVIVRTVVTPLFAPIATFGVVLIFVVFVLLFREDLRDRLVRLVGRHDLHRTILAMNDAAHRLSRYFVTQVAINAVFGGFIAAGLAVVGLPNPVLWGILAGLMRFVPFIGTFIALGPPLLLAAAVAPDWSMALSVMALFVVGEFFMAQVAEPLAYGHSTGLSPIAIILAAAFWAFLWGPVGLLLATPLTVCLVVIGRHVPALAFLEVMLGDQKPLTPAETFYQRALEGNARELAAQARAAVAASSLADYYDRVAMEGLALAQSDLARDALAFERLEAIHQQLDRLVATLAGGAPASPAAAPPEGWRTEGAVVCIPGRGQLDDLAATMAMQVLRGAGFGAVCEANTVLGSTDAGLERLAAARLCCLSVLEEGSSPSAVRYLLRRMNRRMPQAAIVVCLWHADGDSEMLAVLRAEGNEETIVLSLGELVALTRAISARRAAPAMDLAAPPAYAGA